MLLIAVWMGTSLSLVAQPARATYPGTRGRIAFAEFVPSLGQEQIFSIEPDGSDPTQLTHTTNARNFNPAWSADGSKITFERETADGSDIFAMNADGTDLHRVIPFGFGGSSSFYSPDDSTIVFTHNQGEDWSGVFVVDADGTDVRSVQITRFNDAYAQFSPDGTQIVFTQYRRATDSAIFVVNLDGSGLLRLTDWSLGAAGASYKPDGSLLAFNSRSEGIPGQSANIFTMRPDGTELTQLTSNEGGDNAFGASWSPDGTQITFGQLPADGPGDIYVMNPDGSGLTKITHGPQYKHNPDWGAEQ
jgi:Tol biopolymer transport system component